MAGAGYYHMAADQLEKFRAAVADDTTGSVLESGIRAAKKSGYEVASLESLKTAPRGYAKDHPRVELLRRKGLALSKGWEVAPWMHTKSVVKRVRDAWLGALPVTQWLDANVGPSTLPPPDAER
jgi:uncharacterized protein (DUF2461 family)